MPGTARPVAGRGSRVAGMSTHTTADGLLSGSPTSSARARTRLTPNRGSRILGTTMASWFHACLPAIQTDEACSLMDGMPEPPALVPGSQVVEHMYACTGVVSPPDDDLQHLLDRSDAFPCTFGVQSSRLKSLRTRYSSLEDMANSAYPLIHECGFYLLSNFLLHKQRYGTAIERALYADMGPLDLVQRLLKKRAVAFVGPGDYYLLVSGEEGRGGWETVGTDKEKSPLLLRDCLSYDEMKISALLSVSSHTVFVNDGSRTNCGEIDNNNTTQNNGVIVGLIGPRLERSSVMEWQEILVTKEKNITQNGYGTLNPDTASDKYLWRTMWAQFYGILPNFPTYEEILKYMKGPNLKKRFVQLSQDMVFDNLSYQKRIAVSAETLLIEANHRAATAGTSAYVHVVGLGLGVWSISDHQEKEFLDAFASCLKKLGGILTHISDVRFAWFKTKTCGDVGDGEIVGGHIRLHFSMEAPHTLLKGKDAGKLLVVSYAWDCNALPGNEFWLGELCSSGDPAAACSSQVAEIHNPHVNPVKVSGANLYVASPRWGVLHVAEYARRKLRDSPQCVKLLGLDCVKIHSEDAYEPVGRCAPIDGMPKPPELSPDSFVVEHLQACTKISKAPEGDFDELLERSAAFPRQFGVDTVRCRELLKLPGVSRELLALNANSAYPLLHECAFYLLADFLQHKRNYGSTIEQVLYADMSLLALVQRLLDKRAVSFLGCSDRFMLVNGERGYGGWDFVGTESEAPPLVLQDCLSYDEMKLSALLSVSSCTVFINDGRRKNRGVLSSGEESVQRQGVIVGLIGPRVVRRGVNEWQEILVTKDQNTRKNGYGSILDGTEGDGKYQWRMLWARFYGIEPNLPSYDDAVKNYRASKRRVYQRFTELNERELFDNMAYQKRVAVSAETLLLEAEHRAACAGTTAYVHVVGIGLGVWRAADHQEKEFLDSFASCLKKLSDVLKHVSDVRFGWFKEITCGGVGDGGTIAGHIRLHFSTEPPHIALKEKDAGKLLIVSYAWDGNALPGNEFWNGELSSSGDPAAACSTQVAELHNPHINSVKVSAANLHIASPKWGVLHVSEYAQRKLSTFNSQKSTEK